MSPPNTEPTLKLLLIGPSSSGKTSLLVSYTTNTFTPENNTSTIGVDFRIKRLVVHGQPYRLLLFDTAGQERFRTLTSSYYRNAQGVLLVFDVSNRESFLDMERWFAEVDIYAGSRVVKCLVGSKIDKAESRVVGVEEGRELAEKFGAGYIEVSSKTGENVRRAFMELVEKIVEKREAGSDSGGRGGGGGAGGNSSADSEGVRIVNFADNANDQHWGCMC